MSDLISNKRNTYRKYTQLLFFTYQIGKIQKFHNSWQGNRETGPHILLIRMQNYISPQISVQQYLSALQNHGPATSFLGIYATDASGHLREEIFTRSWIWALFAVAQYWKQSKRESVGGCSKCDICSKIYYKNEEALRILIWKGLPYTLLNGKLQVQNSILYA